MKLAFAAAYAVVASCYLHETVRKYKAGNELWLYAAAVSAAFFLASAWIVVAPSVCP